MAQCFHRQQVEGLPGFDSIEEAVRTGTFFFYLVSSMCGGEGICDKCVDPPTCVCFVSSTDVQEGAGPSGQSTASTGHESEEDPQASQESSEEGSGHSSPQEEVEEEEEALSANEVRLHLEDSSPGAGTSQASIRGSPSHSSPNRASPPRVSPSPRPQATSGPRKVSRKTRGCLTFFLNT